MSGAGGRGMGRNCDPRAGRGDGARVRSARGMEAGEDRSISKRCGGEFFGGWPRGCCPQEGRGDRSMRGEGVRRGAAREGERLCGRGAVRGCSRGEELSGCEKRPREVGDIREGTVGRAVSGRATESEAFGLRMVRRRRSAKRDPSGEECRKAGKGGRFSVRRRILFAACTGRRFHSGGDSAGEIRRKGGREAEKGRLFSARQPVGGRGREKIARFPDGAGVS